MTAIAADSFPFNTARPGVTAGAPNTLLRLEGVAVMLGAGFGYQLIHGGWPMFALLFLVPDLSMLGYFAGKRIGAIAYNTGHSYLGPAAQRRWRRWVSPRTCPSCTPWR